MMRAKKIRSITYNKWLSIAFIIPLILMSTVIALAQNTCGSLMIFNGMSGILGTCNGSAADETFYKGASGDCTDPDSYTQLLVNSATTINGEIVVDGIVITQPYTRAVSAFDPNIVAPTVLPNNNEILLQGSGNPDGVYRFNVSESLLEQPDTSRVRIDVPNTNDTVIINVIGGGPKLGGATGFGGGSIGIWTNNGIVSTPADTAQWSSTPYVDAIQFMQTFFDHDPAKLVWNFPDATLLDFVQLGEWTSDIYGTFIAPCSYLQLKATGFNLVGSTVSDGMLTSNATVVHTPYTGAIVGAAPPTDTPTPTNTSTNTPTATPTNTPISEDIAVNALEITQGIQNWNNDMYLVANRVTWARAYVQSTLNDLSGVSARLRAFNGTVELSGSPVSAENNPLTVHTNGGDRLDLNDSFLFYVPAAWRTGNVTFQVEVNYDGTIAENNTSNNDHSETVEFQVSNEMNMMVVPAQLYDKGDTSNSPLIYTRTDPNFDAIINNMYRFHPISQLNIWEAPLLIPPTPLDMRINNEFVQLLYQVNFARTALANPPAANLYWMGMIHPNITTGFLGIAFTPGYASTTKMRPDGGGYNVDWYITGGSTTAHEIGHNKGLKHVKCSGGEGNPDPNFPYTNPNCSLSAVDPTGYYGFDVYHNLWNLNTPSVISNDPSATGNNRGFPLLGYQRARWISPFSYCAVANDYGLACAGGTPIMRSASKNQPQAIRNAVEHLVIGGWVDPNTDNAVLLDVFRQPTTTPLQPTLGTSSIYDIVVLDGSGTVLATENIVFNMPEPIDVQPFLNTIALTAASAEVQIRLNGNTVLTQRIASPNNPTLTLDPIGPTLNEGDTVSWNGTDTDGDSLTYDVLYSADDGATWLSVARSISESSYTFSDLSVLSGSSEARVRVVANDGYNAAEVTSPPFTTPNTAPTSSILAPATGSQYAPGELIILLGSGTDNEDGSLAGTQLSWSSDIDGSLGTGREVATRNLTVGQHNITLTVTDAQGRESTTTHTVFIDTVPLNVNVSQLDGNPATYTTLLLLTSIFTITVLTIFLTHRKQ